MLSNIVFNPEPETEVPSRFLPRVLTVAGLGRCWALGALSRFPAWVAGTQLPDSHFRLPGCPSWSRGSHLGIRVGQRRPELRFDLGHSRGAARRGLPVSPSPLLCFVNLSLIPWSGQSRDTAPFSCPPGLPASVLRGRQGAWLSPWPRGSHSSASASRRCGAWGDRVGVPRLRQNGNHRCSCPTPPPAAGLLTARPLCCRAGTS